ncbi:thioesterase family protein [Solicola sp. PLA-1-18]|uniref:thioesterase family protein n=1 Tax=Solicola sp. PLA-1-18 TaxID=3380532 RepID=UPI003B7E5F3C
MSITAGQSASVDHVVTDDDTALALGSGDLPVLGTPRLVAWCEEATCAAIATEVDGASSSVGTRVDVEHVAASAVGTTVTATAAVTDVDGRLVSFEVVARDDAGQVVAHGRVRRVVVRREPFLARLTRP